MRDVFAMWGNTRMVVLTAITAALYAAILIPFKIVPLIPGVTEVRPANAIPIVCSLLFGPAAAWGAAIGNLIGDFFGGFGPGDLFGFVGNFLYGLVPYKLWSALGDDHAVPRAAPIWWGRFVLVVTVASVLCATTIGWGQNLLGFHPFSVLGPVVLFNNLVAGLLLAPLLLQALSPRVTGARLEYHSVLDVQAAAGLRRYIGVALVIIGTAASFLAGCALSLGLWDLSALSYGSSGEGTRALVVGLGVAPLLGMALLGLVLL